MNHDDGRKQPHHSFRVTQGEGGRTHPSSLKTSDGWVRWGTCRLEIEMLAEKLMKDLLVPPIPRVAVKTGYTGF